MNNEAIRGDDVDCADMWQIAHNRPHFSSKSFVVLGQSWSVLEEILKSLESKLGRLEGTQCLLAGQPRNQLRLDLSFIDRIPPCLPDQK